MLRRFLRRYYVPRRHTILLVAIVMAIAVRPLIGDTNTAQVLFSFSMLGMLLVALLTIQVEDLLGDHDRLLVQRRRRNVIGGMLAVFAVGERLAVLASPTYVVFLIGTVSWLLFIAFVTWSQLRSVLKQRTVTGETISNAVALYLLIGLTWGLLYAIIFLRHPEAFSFGVAPAPDPRHLFPIFIYFSLTTLSTIGFGDIVPVTLLARYAAVAEGIAGQFYLAILVARLVAMQMSASPDGISDQARS